MTNNKQLPLDTKINLENVRIFYSLISASNEHIVGIRNKDKTKIIPVNEFFQQNHLAIMDIKTVSLCGEYDIFSDNIADFVNYGKYLQNDDFALFYAKCLRQQFQGKVSLGELLTLNSIIQKTEKENKKTKFEENLLNF